MKEPVRVSTDGSGHIVLYPNRLRKRPELCLRKQRRCSRRCSVCRNLVSRDRPLEYVCCPVHSPGMVFDALCLYDRRLLWRVVHLLAGVCAMSKACCGAEIDMTA